jgi:hypothetical protein
VIVSKKQLSVSLSCALQFLGLIVVFGSVGALAATVIQ